MISGLTDGYWIFYEGPKYKTTHHDYFKWFTWANRAIGAENFKAQYESRETPEDWTLDVLDHAKGTPRVVAPDATGETATFPPVRLRRQNMLLLACKANQPVEIVLRNWPVAKYVSLLVWDLRDPTMSKITSNTIPHNEAGTVTFEPKADGIYFLGVSAGSCAYSIAKSNVPVGVYAAEGMKLIYGAKRLYFKVPRYVHEFTLKARGYGAETVRVNVFDPTGRKVATAQTTPTQGVLKIKVSSQEQQGEIWSLQITRATEGVLEDSTITLGPKLPPTLSFVPEHVFDLRREK